MLLYQILANLCRLLYMKNIKKSYKNKKFNMAVTMWNDKLELPDGSYFVWDIQDYFEYIIILQ